MEKCIDFFLSPWHYICQFSTISNKIEVREKLSNKNFKFLLYNKRENICLRVAPRAPFYLKLLKIDIHSTLDIRKHIPIFQVCGFTHAPPTLLVFRVVLLHKCRGRWERLFRASAWYTNCENKENLFKYLITNKNCLSNTQYKILLFTAVAFFIVFSKL